MTEYAVVSTTILIVDDEEKIREFVCNYLKEEGYEVLQANSGREALSIIDKRSDLSMVLLDWMMPELSGLEVFKRIRTISEVPVIFLTAKSEEIDKLLVLELGADDIISKPFSIRELATRIKVVLRRIQRSNSTQVLIKEDDEDVWIRGQLKINTTRREVFVEGKEIILTPTEYKLLITLASSPGRVYSRLQLLENALGEEYAGYERSIDTHISNLRKKIDTVSTTPMIITVFGVGYRFEQ